MKIIRLLILLLFSLPAFAQTDTCNLQISLLTCGPGEELYSIFGHSAIRVKDKLTSHDIIFNYGTFDFDDPDFYAKFLKGNLLYFVSTGTFDNFLYEYEYEGRSVVEQTLNLTCEQKEKLFNDLRVNAREENKYYHYDFVHDNCSTRLRDILKKNNATFNDFIQDKNLSFRNMLNDCLDKGNQPWSKFGIDLILGSPLDKKAGYFNSMFLPEYLMNGFDKATINNKPLVAQTKTILSAKEIPLQPANSDNPQAPLFQRGRAVSEPIFIFTALFIIILIFSLLKIFWVQSFLNIFDITYFFLLGILGFFILFMWFGTHHQLADNNYNLLWAMPTHLPIAFVMLRNKNWVKKYFTITTFIYLVLIVLWKWLPQGMNFAFLPLALTALTRCYFRSIKK
jgi:hypothetical protein